MDFITKKNIIIILIIFLGSTPFVTGAFKECGVTINQPWFYVNDSEGNGIFIVDNEGDIFFEGKSHIEDRTTISTTSTFEIYDLFFNKDISYIKNVYQNQSSIPNSIYGTIIKGNDTQPKTLITKGGNIYTKGLTLYQESQAACNSDGKYCNGNILENRDYFCDLVGLDACTHNVISSQDCTTKLSLDSDGGDNPTTYGEITDYTTCKAIPGNGNDECDYNTLKDTCLSTSTLKEYSNSGSSYTSRTLNCDDELHTKFCTGLDRKKTVYSCNVGNDECELTNPSLFLERCDNTPSNIYTSWSCTSTNPGKRTRDVTTFSNVCSPNTCLYPSTTTPENQNCGAGEYCTGGSCQTITYTWATWWGGCSASCGGGTQTLYSVCKRDYDGATVADSYCPSPKPTGTLSCNTAPCCTPKSVSIYNGNGNCATACSNIGQICSSTSHNNFGMDGAHWGPWDPGCGYTVRGWPGDCGLWGGATSCGPGKSKVTSGSAICYCKCP